MLDENGRGRPKVDGQQTATAHRVPLKCESTLDTSIPDTGDEKPLALQITLCIAALALMLGLMYWTYATPTMSGDHVGLWTFIGLWFRELLLVAFIALAFVALAAYSLWKACRRAFTRLR
jgi:hypothetical protein